MSTPTPPNPQPQWQQPHMPPGQNGQPGPQQPYQGPGQPGPQPPYQGPGQPPYGQHPGATTFAPAPPPQKKKHGLGFWLLIGVLVIVALIVVSCTAALAGGSNGGSAAPAASSSKDTGGASDDPSSESSQAATRKAEATTAGVGDSVKAGDWQFKVISFECGHKSVGGQYLNKKAQGQFCFLKITAKNNGDDEGTLDGASQKLSDDDGKTYSSDTEAALYEDPDDTLFLKGVNPGNTAKGLVVFDVPKKAKITQVSLSGGMFGGAAKVSLS